MIQSRLKAHHYNFSIKYTQKTKIRYTKFFEYLICERVFFSFSPRFPIRLSRSYEFGPCVGIPRLERWERAQALGLKPPKEVFDLYFYFFPSYTEVLPYCRSMTF